MTARRLKVAVVGAGISGSPDGRERWAVRAHLPALKALPDLYETVAVCTTRMETATAAAHKFDVPHAFDSVERMFEERPRYPRQWRAGRLCKSALDMKYVRG